MSIPKEPRQLMINLMYLVLTALLALNVSAEVMNAFFSLDNSISSTNTILDTANDKVIESMEKTVEERTQYQPFVDAAQEASDLVQEFNTYIDNIRNELEEQAGGLFPDDYKDPIKAGRPKRFKDKEIPTRYFVDGQEVLGVKQEPKGPELKQRILDTRQRLVDIVSEVAELDIAGTQITDEDIQGIVDKITLNIDDESWKLAKKPTWEEYVFGHMPVAACYPILRKFQNDANNSEATIVNFLSSKIGATVIEFDQFFPVAKPEKGYIIRGETYNADIVLSAYSSQAAEGISMEVNDQPIPIENGIGKYSIRPTSIGEKQYKVDITVVNPFTQERETYSETFRYEVGERSVAVSADKMNVFYIGVDNPISVSAAGISSNDLRVSISGGGQVRKVGSNNYIVTVSQPGEATINVSGGGLSDSKMFRVKRIPDPVARLSNSSGGNIGNGEFKAQGGVGAFLDNFDFDANCVVVGYELVYLARRQDPVPVTNAGARFNEQARRLVDRAKPGDNYFFNNVRAKCPGDEVSRPINSMVFTIK